MCTSATADTDQRRTAIGTEGVTQHEIPIGKSHRLSERHSLPGRVMHALRGISEGPGCFEVLRISKRYPQIIRNILRTPERFEFAHLIRLKFRSQLSNSAL
jgi:hypothetical protein